MENNFKIGLIKNEKYITVFNKIKKKLVDGWIQSQKPNGDNNIII